MIQMIMQLWLWLWLCLSILAVVKAQVQYGVDISYPMHHEKASVNFDYLPHNVDPKHNPVPDEYRDMPVQPLGDRQTFHDRYIEGCRQMYSDEPKMCDKGEDDRVEMALRQPQSMRNYTTMGFTKIRAPEHVFELIKTFWDINKDSAEPEKWRRGNIYTNHWEAPSKMLSVEDQNLEGGGTILKSHIWNAARSTIENWTGQRLAECSLYGIRIYPEGAVLASHVDRLPLVASAIINVDQDVDEPWPLEVIGHDGKAYNVTMLPGDLVLYESHSVIHGRPFPLKGRFMANIFIHFEPVGPLNGKLEYTGGLPPYLIPGSPEEEHWKKSHKHGHRLHGGGLNLTSGSTPAHKSAQTGNFADLKFVLDENEELVHARDENGWTPIHEAVRGGNLEVIQLLLGRGADANSREGPFQDGGSPLYFVDRYHQDHNKIEQIKSLLKQYDGKWHARTPPNKSDEL